MAVKTSSSIGILEYKNKDKDFQLNFMINNEEINKTKQIITCLDFSQSFYKYKEPMILIIGYKNGKLVLYNVDNRQAYQKYNIYENNKKSAMKILQYPTNLNTNMNYAVLFSDGNVYLMDHKFPDLNYYENIKKQQYSQQKIDKSKSHLDPKHPENNFEIIDDKVIKVNCSTVSDMEVVSSHQLLSYLQCGHLLDKNNKESCFLIGYCGFDGLFRLIDLLTVNNVMSVKSYYGGFNSFSFSDGYELLGLAGQDDCASIIDMKTKGFLRIIQHQSFVSKILFQNVGCNKFIIYSGSLDTRLGTLVTTVKELQYKMRITEKQQNYGQNKANQTVEIDINGYSIIEIPEQQYFKISRDAIGHITQIDKLIVISSYDGSVCVWDLTLQEPQNIPI